MKTETKIKDFVILPRKIKDDYSNRKLTKNELDVLIWIWLNTNPYNGVFSADYKALEREFQGRISYDNIRKIISSLRKNGYISFSNHKGRKGSFPVYPIGFLLTNGEIQTFEYLKNRQFITSQSQSKEQLKTEPENNLEGQYHNFKEQKERLIKRISIDSQNHQITTSYNDNDNDTKNNKIVLPLGNTMPSPNSSGIARASPSLSSSFLNFKKSQSSSCKERVISVDGFYPKTYEEERCWEIAKTLGEKDMRFLLSCLKKYGINHIERAWMVFQEKPEEEIENPPAYFNKLIGELTPE